MVTLKRDLRIDTIYIELRKYIQKMKYNNISLKIMDNYTDVPISY